MTWNLTFDAPWVLALIPVVWILVIWRSLRLPKLRPAWQNPLQASGFHLPNSFRQKCLPLLWILRLLALSLCLVALAIPRGFIGFSKSSKKIVDIQLVLDVSLSMMARDFEPNRLESAKKIGAEFIESRPDDRIGLVTFSGESYAKCPLTTDHGLLLDALSSVEAGVLGNGTAIGMGVATAVSRLRKSEAVSKIVILLTDGENNAGDVAPLTAAEMARNFEVRLYTIGVGKKGKAMAPVALDAFGQIIYGPTEVRIDEPLLKEMAQTTGGKYFRATNEVGLRQIFQDIDQMEKTLVEVKEYQRKPHRYHMFLVVAAAFLGLELLLRFTWLKTLN
jgi:Ca-activated chloride channel family protein